MEISNYYYSFLQKLIVFTVNEHRDICIVGLNRQAGYATDRDDGLGALHNLNAQDLDRKRKDITEIFKKLGLETNLKAVNLLDVTLDLRNESYKPYRKPIDNPLYINASSNHPPSIIKQLPKNISKRISEISSSKEIFDQAAPYYNNALKASGYKERIAY